jgi:predicted regulator of Ras-like GTPase activity (Roadblock/LC7/MglB family)
VTPFTRILTRAIADTPGAIGGAFAAPDGEMVDCVTTGDPTDLAILTAHYGVILASLEALLDTQHFGGTQYFVIENGRVDIVIHTVDDGYYAMLAVPTPAPLGCAIGALRQAALELRREMR